MKFLTRTIIVLVAFNITTGNIALAQDRPEQKTVTISGSVGLPGVRMIGLPRNIVTDQNGYYQATVPSGFTGTVKPTKEGYTFEPASMVYANVISNRDSQDYMARAITFIISGNAGVSGVQMAGLPDEVYTDQKGYYEAKVLYGWSGTVMPVKRGYTFSPPELMYSKVIKNQPNDNYVAKPVMVTVSGMSVVGDNPTEGVLIVADNNGGSTTTDAQGRCSLRVPYGWSGTVTARKEGVRFDPPSATLSNVTGNEGVVFYGRPERPGDEGADLFGGSRSYRLRSGRRGSAASMDMMYDPSGSPPRGRGSSGYKPTIRSGGRKALVIPAGEIKPKELAETIEDMHVMSHILDESFKEKRRIQGMFTDFGAFFGRDSRSAEATYLQGYGVLFLMEVNFTFSPPPRKQAQDPAETTETVDSTWQKARQRVLSPGASPGMDQEDSARDYDNHMVEELKKELIEALKHASNIRNIEPDEWVILTVIGGQRQFGMGFGGGMGMGGGMSEFGSSSRSSGSPGAGGGMGGGYGGGGGGFVGGGYGGVGGMMGSGTGGGMGGMYSGMATYGGTTFSSSTVLTIRARKGNVDEFAAGLSDLEQFQQHVQIFTY